VVSRGKQTIEGKNSATSYHSAFLYLLFSLFTFITGMLAFTAIAATTHKKGTFKMHSGHPLGKKERR